MDVLGDYIILKVLGQGAVSTVYLAEHRFIKKQFAIKVLPDQLATDLSFMRRFEAKVSQIAALDHPNIVKIHNVSFQDGKYFLVMDPIVDSLDDIMNLDRFLQFKGKSLLESEVVSILSQVAQSLDFAHAHGVIHGSLKLSNILLKPSESSPKVYLSDFGMQRIIGEGFSFLSLCSEMSKAFFPQDLQDLDKIALKGREFVKNFSFLAPEQKFINATGFDAKVDSYAFGVLVYYILTGVLPEGCFEFPRSIVPDLKGNWDELIRICLQVNPTLRPENIEKILEQILQAPAIQPVEPMEHISEIETKVENAFQLAFDFPQKVESFVETAEVSAPSLPKPILKPAEIIRPEYEPDPGAIFQRELQVSHYTPLKVEIKEIEPILTEMVVIPSGYYFRGSSDGARDEIPRHKVRLSSFAMDIHAVTNEQFVRFLQAMGGEKDQHNNDIIRLRDSRIKRNAGKLVIESGYAKHPVVGVTWYGASAYAKWVGKRLPTEAEWEAAASSGKDSCIFPTGLEIDRTQANFFSSDTTPVMSYPPNCLGIYDMAGNVYDWCNDWYAYNYYESSSLEPDNPRGPNQGVYRVLRGGCWKSLRDDLRCSHRHRNNPGAVNGTYGFRCAADVS